MGKLGTGKPFTATKIWNSHFIRAMSVSTIFFIANQLSLVGFPLYMTSLGANPALIGIAASTLPLIAMLSRPIVGPITDKMGRKFAMVMGLSVLMLCFVGYSVLPIIAAAMVFRAMSGYGLSACSTANMTIAADVLPESKIEKGLAYFGLCETVASAVGPSLTLALIFGANFFPVWLTGIILTALAITIILTFTYEKNSPRKTAASGEKVGFLWSFLEKSALAPSLIQSVTVIAMSGVMSFLAPYAAAENIPNIGVFFAVQACAMCAVRIFAGKILSGLSSPLLILIPAFICQSLAFFFISIMTDLVFMIPGAILYGLGLGAIMATISVMVMSRAAPQRRGAASSTFYFMCDIGACIGSFSAGQLANAFGYSRLFLIFAALPAISLVMSLFIFGKNKRR